MLIKSPVFKLSVMMFLEFLVLGSTMPIISLYLKSYLGFSGIQVGWILAGSALSSIISPVIGAFIADRIVSAERLLAIAHLLAFFLLYQLTSMNDFISVFICFTLYWMLVGPTTALTTAITFHHAPTAIKTFGGIRLWGTLGWITAAWIFRFFFSGASIGGNNSGCLRNALLMGAFASLVISAFSLTIPRGYPASIKKKVLFPKDSLKVLLRKDILVFSFFTIFISIADRMYQFGAAPYLKSLHFMDKNIMPALSVGQIPEVAGLAILGFFLTKYGIKRALLAGAFLEILRFFLFVLQVKGILLYLAISLHGLTYAFFFVTASIFLDNNSTPENRSGVHQYFALITGGCGTLLGNSIAGVVADSAGIQSGKPSDFILFWIFPLVISSFGFIGILLAFNKGMKINNCYAHRSTTGN